MQKWLPDEFSSSSRTSVAANTDPSVFESDNSRSDAIQTENQRLFMSESGFSGPDAIMAHLTREERAQVFELVEQDIKAEYQERETELREQFQKDLSSVENQFTETFNQWTENLHRAMAIHMKETADASARLAVQLAEKIVRQKIIMDNEILVKAIETALFKIDGTKSITVNINPEQAQWLESQDQLREKLGIEQIVSDRRIDPGGCLVKTEKQQWDVTIAGQLNYLSELVEEMITTADAPALAGEEGTDAEPILE